MDNVSYKLAKNRMLSDTRFIDSWRAKLISIILISDSFDEAKPKIRKVLNDKTMQGR